MHVVEVLEGFQLVFEVRRRPEQHPVHTLSPQGADQPFDKRMGHGDIRHTLDFGHPQYPQVGVPLVKPVQRVMIGAEACRTEWSSNRMAKHAAEGTAIHAAGMDTKADDPSGVLVHDHQHPMASQDRRLAPEQVHTPQAVLRVPQKRQPGGAAPTWGRPIVRREHPADHVLVDLDVEGQTDLLGDPRTAPPGIAPLHRHHGVHQGLGRPFRAGATAPGGKQPIGTCGDAASDGNRGSSTASGRSPSGARGPGA